MYDILLKTPLAQVCYQFLMGCNVITLSVETGYQSAHVFALQSQLDSLQIIVSGN